MSGRVSAEMLTVHKLLRKGYTPYAAAKEAGMRQSSITRCKTCQKIIKEVKEAEARDNSTKEKTA